MDKLLADSNWESIMLFKQHKDMPLTKDGRRTIFAASSPAHTASRSEKIIKSLKKISGCLLTYSVIKANFPTTLGSEQFLYKIILTVTYPEENLKYVII